MGSTYYSIHQHIVFSTKERRPLISSVWCPQLHEYLGGIVRGMGGVAEAIGGVEDHVHLLVSMKTTDAPADLVRDLKKASSLWDEDGETREFMCGGCEKCVIVDRLLACCLDIAPRGFLEQLLRA